ncbi:MAG: beta-galactosidase [Anaerolineae bacterium]|nr:beta-galactosidase [Anaerolineae bacterium]
MIRRFRQHDLRQMINLGGVWDFEFLGDVDVESVDVNALTYPDRMAVPGAFDATPAYAGQRGLAAYRTSLIFRDSTPHRLVFSSVHHWCRVLVGGQVLRDHVGGFTQFAVEVTAPEPGETEVVVLVDNRLDYQRCPLHLDYFDWYHFGGITRPVEFQRLGDLWIDALQIVTTDFGVRKVQLTLDYASTQPAGPTELVVTCDERVVLSESVDLTEARGSIERSLKLEGSSLWSPREPNLHLLEVRLGDDDWRERIGIRQVMADGQQILINHEPVTLYGVNRHEAHPQFGPALPDQILAADVQQLKDLGCNFVRSSHYPADPRFLDLCDEAGILVWNEATGWQQTVKHLTDPHYVQAAQRNIEEMVAMSINRPSVILWGLLNESDSTHAASRPAYEQLIGCIRALDPSRLVTYASNHPFNDLCLDLVDVVSINTYPGWYMGEIEDIGPHLDQIAAHLDEAGFAQKPLIISEIGAGAVPGWRDWNATRWSEQYQVQLLDAVIRHLFIDRERYAGLAIWQFCDLRSSELASRILGRPRGFNNKGLVDEYRRPKLAYELVKQHYRNLGGS